MRKLLLTTAAVAAAIAGAVAGETDFGTFTDTRDGQTYKTVKIGEQTWMAQNLNYKTTSDSWCYENKPVNCNKYGRLYTWDAAIMACPAKYHLPSREEWDKLGQAVGGERTPDDDGYIDWLGAGTMLKSKNGNGTNEYGFSALPGGIRIFDGEFGHVGNVGYWWTASRSLDTDNDYDAYYRIMDKNHNKVYEHSRYKNNGFSVRCVADNT